MRIFKTLWGVSDLDNIELWDRTLARIKSDGFDGVEFAVGPFNPGAQNMELFVSLLHKHELAVIAQLHTCGIPITSYKLHDHIDDFKKWSLEAAKLQPVLINSHSGKDSFTMDESLEFFRVAVDWEKTHLGGIKVVHETHRSRILYSPFAYRDLLASGKLPQEVKIAADLSHWAVVCERCPDERGPDADFWAPVLADLAKRTDLIHCRVGYAQGPQVNDPEAPEHKDAVDAHIRWWKILVAGMKSRNVEPLIEPEFGPFPYLQTLPFTNVPVADVESINRKFGMKVKKILGEDSQLS